MSTGPYAQPEPFDPAMTAAPVRSAPTRPKRPWLPILGAILLAAVAFGGGFAVATATSSGNTPRTAANGNGNFGPGASGRLRTGGGGAAGFGGGASGTVGTVSANQMTITTAAGGSRIVLLTSTTTVTQVSSATKTLTDLASGQTVTVIGSSNPDGSVTATNVVIGNVGLFGRGGFGGPSASSTP
jgi:hypothetical protein